MTTRRLLTLLALLILVAGTPRATAAPSGDVAFSLRNGSLPAPSASSPEQAGPCTPGASYDPACDVDHDGDVDVIDVQLAASHWNQTGAWTGGDFWSLTGNAGTVPGVHFLGTTDNQPLELRVGGQRVLRLEPRSESPNLIGGYAGNVIGEYVRGGIIASGGRSGEPNIVNDAYNTIGGGKGNVTGTDNGDFSFESHATVGGGGSNTASNAYTTIGGGRSNTASGSYATIGGGYSNTASGHYSTVSGGTGAAASHFGELAYASGSFAAAGDAQTSLYVLRRETNDNTLNEMFLDGATQRITLAADRVTAA